MESSGLMAELISAFSDMKVVPFFVTLGLGLILGVVVCIAVIAWRKHSRKGKKSEEVLKRNFGEPSVVTTFTYNEALDWIIQHDDLMKNGHEAVIFKVNNQTLKMVNRKFNVDFGVEKYLVVGIRKKKELSISDSVLVKYDRLDERLENELAPGKGFLVIE